MTEMKNVTCDALIIGAGISGLATAFNLQQKGLNVRVIEKADRPGGSIRTEFVDGFLVEHGPNSTLDTSPDIHELFRALGIEAQMEYANERANNRYIVRNGRLNALPMSPPRFLATPLFSLSAKLRLFKEPFIAASDPNMEESLAQFVTRRLGQEFLDYAINPFVAGVYAGSPEELSVRAGFPKLYALEQNHGSLIKGAIKSARERKRLAKQGETSKQNAKLFSFPKGMQTIITALTGKLGDHAHLSTRIEAIRQTAAGYEVQAVQNGQAVVFSAPKLIFAIPTHAYDQLKFEFDFPLRDRLKAIQYPPVTMAFFGYKSNPAAIPLDGFGFLVPKKENKQILGTIWSSTIFANRAPTGGIALTTFVGGSRQPENALLPQDQLVELVLHDLRDLMGITARPDALVTRCWERAIPQYNLGHLDLINAVETFEKTHPGLYFSGNFRGGISVGDCIKQAKLLSQKFV